MILSTYLEAESLGLGSCILDIYDRDELGRLLNIPAGYQHSGHIAVGYPKDNKVRVNPCKALERIVRSG
ncbi:MAG: nitroreductase family protein [Candidatus Adiutrix intracellularis]|nr:nitroreductase family protein [Candidatus Adiutrix intracellularis]